MCCLTPRAIVRVCSGIIAALTASAALAEGASGVDAAVSVAEAAPRQDLIIAAAPAPVPAAAPLTRTRFVAGLDRKVDAQVLLLSNPNRIIVELPEAKLQLPNQAENNPVGLVKSFRGGVAAPGRMRIVIDVTQPVIVESTKVEKDGNGHYRLALDILPADAALKAASKKGRAAPSGLGASGLQPPLPKRAEKPRDRDARTFKPVIVIDPGHGGIDSGATKRGTVEKNVVLAFSQALRDQLEETGRYKVLLTRNDDTFVELDERSAFAERNNANLFIAVHADYAGTRARGATIFSLRDGVAKGLRRSAINNAAGKALSAKDAEKIRQASGDVDAVRNILGDLAERDVEATQERSNIFAKTVIENMSDSTTMRNEPDQQAAFRVLKTAQFPSVLIELAYVSNEQDARNLKSDEWRGKVAGSIVDAIDNYFSNQLARLPL